MRNKVDIYCFLDIFYHFESKSEKKFFWKKSDKGLPLHFSKNHLNPHISSKDDSIIKIQKDLNSAHQDTLNRYHIQHTDEPN